MDIPGFQDFDGEGGDFAGDGHGIASVPALAWKRKGRSSSKPLLMAEIRHPPVEVGSLLGGGFKHCFYFHPALPGEMIQFHEHIFQMG